MEKKPEQLAFYESDMIKDLVGALKGRAPAGLMASFRTSQILFGMTALNQISGFLEASLQKEDKRALIIADDYTEKYVGRIIKVLSSIDMESKVWSGVKPEGPLDTIEEAVKICQDFKPKILVAIGGGSVIDTAKAVMIKYEKPESNLYMILPFGSLGLRKKLKYFIAIPTTSGTGSEVTNAAMLTDINRDPPKKLALAHSELVPDFAILQTEFVKDMPPFLTMATGFDALAHAAGSYVSSWGNPLTDAMNIYAIKEIIKYLPRAYKYGVKDIEARSHMQLAALMAGLGFSNSRVGIDHALGHSLGKVFRLHHGLCVGMFLPYTIAFQAKISKRWKDLCPLFEVDFKSKGDKNLFNEFLQSVKDFIHSLDGPVCAKEIKNPVINEEEYYKNLDLLVKYAESDAVALLSSRYIDKEILKRIFEYAWDGRTIDF